MYLTRIHKFRLTHDLHRRGLLSVGAGAAVSKWFKNIHSKAYEGVDASSVPKHQAAVAETQFIGCQVVVADFVHRVSVDIAGLLEVQWAHQEIDSRGLVSSIPTCTDWVSLLTDEQVYELEAMRSASNRSGE